MSFENRKYPIGKFDKNKIISEKELMEIFDFIEEFPSLLKTETYTLNSSDFNRTYRSDGWTITQIIHHLADSHMNAYIRLKLTISEVNPVIKPYKEGSWAQLEDYNFLLITDSLQIIESVTNRLTNLIRSLTTEHLKREYFDPSTSQSFTIQQDIMLFQWHALHHLHHIRMAKQL